MSELDRILASKRDEVLLAKQRIAEHELRAMCADQDRPRGFLRALRESPHDVALIAEVKAASPSQGKIRDLDVASVVADYEEAGADCLSVLTDAPFFGGSLENLRRARELSPLPVLRKDFIVDPYQVWEARANGADAILLIVAALEREALRDLRCLAIEIGMDVLVEAHDERECDEALAVQPDLVGVNNRDLGSLAVDLATGERLLPRVAPHALAVAESGLARREDVERMRAAGAGAVLIGTAFCASSNIPSKVKEVMGW